MTKMTFEQLRQFIAEDMRMSQVYQPVMLTELLRRGGSASVSDIAQAILDRDPTQIEYFTEIVKNMVGSVLTKRRGITEKNGEKYILKGADQLTPDQVDELVALCKKRIDQFEVARGGKVWAHRRRGHRPVPGSVRYKVLSAAKFRCELCGVSADEKNLEVDHIFPKSLGGRDDITNYQALCYTCNAAKRNTDDTDFRNFKHMFEAHEDGCLFCNIQSKDRKRIVAENTLAYAIRDGFEVTPGHTLFIPKRHVSDYFDLFKPERNAIEALITKARDTLQNNDQTIEGFNTGANSGTAAGQTVLHAHVHLIPRRQDDVENPRGGVRGVIPAKQQY